MIEQIKTMYQSYDTIQSVIFSFWLVCVVLFIYFYTRTIMFMIKSLLTKNNQL